MQKQQHQQLQINDQNIQMRGINSPSQNDRQQFYDQKEEHLKKLRDIKEETEYDNHFTDETIFNDNYKKLAFNNFIIGDFGDQDDNQANEISPNFRLTIKPSNIKLDQNPLFIEELPRPNTTDNFYRAKSQNGFSRRIILKPDNKNKKQINISSNNDNNNANNIVKNNNVNSNSKEKKEVNHQDQILSMNKASSQKNFILENKKNLKPQTPNRFHTKIYIDTNNEDGNYNAENNSKSKLQTQTQTIINYNGQEQTLGPTNQVELNQQQQQQSLSNQKKDKQYKELLHYRKIYKVDSENTFNRKFSKIQQLKQQKQNQQQYDGDKNEQNQNKNNQFEFEDTNIKAQTQQNFYKIPNNLLEPQNNAKIINFNPEIIFKTQNKQSPIIHKFNKQKDQISKPQLQLDNTKDNHNISNFVKRPQTTNNVNTNRKFQYQLADSHLLGATFYNGGPTNLEKFQLGPTIGQGSYAVVRIAKDIENNNRKVAIKTYDKFKLLDPQRKSNVKREIQILQNLDNPYIIKLYSVIDTRTNLHLIMEYVGQQSMKNYLKQQENRKLSETETKQLFKQIVLGINYCHANAVCHRDIKLENLLLQDKKYIKLIDFGFAVKLQSDNKLSLFCGTPCYMAPELCMKKKYDGKCADVWSLGILLYVMLQGKYPFKAQQDRELFQKIVRGTYRMPSDISIKAQNIIDQMLQFNPEQRLTSEEILRHEWFNN